ncbi:MAG: S-layer homology domain-containing protein [Clostridia bacterium]|nr:S-layer homology domain-containing protein [Clostridia bacterium]
MKKILLIFISLLVMICSLTPVFSSENSLQISGVDEFLDKICLNSDANIRIREKMQESYQAYLEKIIPQIMENPDYAKQKMGIKIGDDEYEIAQIRDMFVLDMDKGLLNSNIITIKYLNQYSKENCLLYLFSDINVFDVKCIVHGGATFTTDGTLLQGDELTASRVLVDDKVYEYLNNRTQLKKELEAKGETQVQDIKLFGIGNLTFLYVKCYFKEYLVKLYDYGDMILPKIELYELYEASEIMSAFNDIDVQNSPYSQVLSKLVLETKPAYDTEAESLQADGLLKGNEKGLDLLKPLTRIEATAILVRAMGYEDVQTSQASYFTDIQSDNWGAKYANIAKDKGIASGVGDDMFAPNDTITASQFATLILRNMGETPDWQTAINTFVERGLITSEQAEKMNLFTRGDMAKIIYEAKQRNMF